MADWRAVELPRIVRSIAAEQRRATGRHRHTARLAAEHAEQRQNVTQLRTMSADLAAWAKQLEWSELYWVAPAMMTLAEDAATDMPASALGPEMPDYTGVIAFGSPLGPILAEDRMHGMVSIWMVSWLCDGDAVRLSAWCPMSDLSREQQAACALDPTDEWAAFCDLQTPRHEPLDDWDGDAWGVKLVRFVAACWVLMQMPTLAETRRAPVSPSARARARKQRREIRPVRIIDLRRLAHEPAQPNLEISSRNYRHRWVVRGHWRQQAYGPGRELRRPKFIAPHVKGPEGAPLLPTDHVSIWRR